jgi:hypothetical protein
MTGEEEGHALRDQADVEGVGGADPHLPGEPAAARLEHGDALVDFLQGAHREAEEELASLGGDDLLADPVEQGLADLFLELADLVRQGRLGDVHPRRGPREAEVLGHGNEVTKMPQLSEPGCRIEHSVSMQSVALGPVGRPRFAPSGLKAARQAIRGATMSEYNQGG